MPEAPEIELLKSVGVMARQVRHNRFLRVCGNGRADRRLSRINHGRISAAIIHQEARQKRRMPRKVLPLKDTFADGDSITRLDAKTSAATLRELLGIHLENLVTMSTLSSHGYSFRRGDT